MIGIVIDCDVIHIQTTLQPISLRQQKSHHMHYTYTMMHFECTCEVHIQVHQIYITMYFEYTYIQITSNAHHNVLSMHITNIY
jgi:hypothetical protein